MNKLNKKGISLLEMITSIFISIIILSILSIIINNYLNYYIPIKKNTDNLNNIQNFTYKINEDIKKSYKYEITSEKFIIYTKDEIINYIKNSNTITRNNKIILNNNDIKIYWVEISENKKNIIKISIELKKYLKSDDNIIYIEKYLLKT